MQGDQPFQRDMAFLNSLGVEADGRNGTVQYGLAEDPYLVLNSTRLLYSELASLSCVSPRPQ